MTVPTVDEVFRGYWTMKDAELPPAEHDPLVAFEVLAACDWWGWHELQRESVCDPTDKEEPKE